MPAGWSTSGSGSVGVSSLNVVAGSQNLELHDAFANYASEQNTVGNENFVIETLIRPSSYVAPEYNFGGYGWTYAFSQGYEDFAGGVLFRVQDADDLSGVENPTADELQILFWQTAASQQVVGSFVYGAWYVGGTIAELSVSDNLDLTAIRNSADVQSRVFLELTSTSPTETPSLFAFTLEAAVFARSAVTQSIDLFDYQLASFEEVDVRPANRFTDLVTTVEATGDLSRFVQPSTGEITARVRYESVNPRQQFSANIDQTIWGIRE